MRLVDAVWDTRNLGLSTQELILEHTDTLQSIDEALRNLKSDYQVIRVHGIDFQVFEIIGKNNFVFAEQLSFWKRSLDQNYLDFFKKNLPKLDAQLSTEEEHQLIYREIEMGLFSTDRISQNPMFGQSISSQRYINWLKDEQLLGAELFTLSYKQKPVGFFSLRMADQGPFVALSGIFMAQQVPGSGIALQREIQITAAKAGASEITTVVSTGNSSAVRAHIAAGFQWAGMQTVFTKNLI